MKLLIEKIRLILPPQYREREILFQKVKSGDRNAKNRLVEMYLRNALRIALEASEVSSLPLDDIFSETVVGLMERLNCPTESKNYSAFISAGMHIKAYNYVRKNDVNFMSYEDYCKKVKEKYYDGEWFLIRHIYLEQLNETLSEVMFINLTQREEKVLNLRFGLGDYDKHSHLQIAEMFEADKNRIRFIERRALSKLKPSFNFPNNLKDFL